MFQLKYGIRLLEQLQTHISEATFDPQLQFTQKMNGLTLITLIQLRAPTIVQVGRKYPEYKMRANKNTPPRTSAGTGLENDAAIAR